MGKIYYDLQNNWPEFHLNGLPPLIGWNPSEESSIKIIYNYDQVYEVLINSGLTPEEAYHFFEEY